MLFILYTHTYIDVYICKHNYKIYTNIINKKMFVICIKLPIRRSHTEHKQSNPRVKSWPRPDVRHLRHGWTAHVFSLHWKKYTLDSQILKKKNLWCQHDSWISCRWLISAFTLENKKTPATSCKHRLTTFKRGPTSDFAYGKYLSRLFAFFF